jgi:predicted MPP superfamily phosphohydrolase
VKNRSAKFLLAAAVTGAALLCAAAFILFDAFFLEPLCWVSVSHVTVHNPRLAAALKGVRLVQISDLHLRDTLGFQEKMLIRRVNRLRPDLILVTGDLAGAGNAAPLVARLLRRLKPRLWSYGVLGNSDRVFLRGRDFKESWKRSGLSLVGGRSLKMNPGKKPFWLAGMDFPGYGKFDIEARLDSIFAGIDSSDPVIFLSYSPDLAPLIAARGADLILSGDTHGGQVTFPGWSYLFRSLGRSRFIRGLYRVGRSILYVNRGIATKEVPVRFLCPPEITVFSFIN